MLLNLLDLVSVPIGGISKNPEEVIELLGLPKYTFHGRLIVVYAADESHKKPRIPFVVLDITKIMIQKLLKLLLILTMNK